MLEERFLQPDGFAFKVFVTPDGVTHRYGFIKPKNTFKKARGTIVILHGFSEFIEKYFETIGDLVAAGYAVYSFDWRGQGKSDRWFKDNFEQVYQTGFDKDAQNLHYFVKVVIGEHAGPLYAIGHSMGGHIALLTLKTYPKLFRAVALSAPMIRFTLPAPNWLALWFLNIARFLGFDKKPIGKGGDWSYKKPPIEQDPRSRDAKRRLVHYQWCEQDKDLRLGDISIEWVYQALKSVIVLNGKGFLEAIQTPVLIGMASEDKIVDNAAMRRAAERLPNATLLELDGSCHEIFMERDVIRDEFIAKTLAFFKENR